MTTNEFRDGRLILVSGLDGKSPACFLIESGGRRILLDLGVGANGEPVEGIDRIGRVDALLISHCTPTMSAASSTSTASATRRVFATEETWSIVDRLHPGAPKQVPPASLRKLLPLQGSLEISAASRSRPAATATPPAASGCGSGSPTASSIPAIIRPNPSSIRSTRRRRRRSPWSTPLMAAYRSDRAAGRPPGREDRRRCRAPVPVGGRGPEIALRLEELGLPRAWLDPNVFEQMERLASAMDRSPRRRPMPPPRASLAEPMAAEPKPTDIVICTNGAADDGMSAELLARWGGSVPFVFTGHVPKETPLTRRWRGATRPSTGSTSTPVWATMPAWLG